MRTPDKPGKFRISQKGGEWLLSGIRRDGRRVKMRFNSPDEANGIANTLFATPIAANPTEQVKIDDWGIPIARIDSETVDSIASGLGIPKYTGPSFVEAPPTPVVVEKPEEKARKASDKKRTESLCEFLGFGFSAGNVYLSRKLTVSLGKEPVNPSEKMVKDLAKSTQETLTSWFGDTEIKPWQMMLLLMFAMPTSMILQSPPRKKLEDGSENKVNPNLRSVP